MSQWSSAKAKRVLAALLRIGWTIKRESSSHKILSRPGWSDVVFAFHDRESKGVADLLFADTARRGGYKTKLKTLGLRRLDAAFYCAGP